MSLRVDLAETPPIRPGSVVIVDDDPVLRNLLREFLLRHGFQVRAADGGADLEALLAENEPIDVIVLDVMMPGEGGLSICRRLTDKAGPGIVMHSALGAEEDRIVGLELGADAYLPKPCSPREILAQVRAVVRRRRSPRATKARPHEPYHFKGWSLDPLNRALTRPDGVTVQITSRDFLLLRALLDRPNQMFTREQLADLGQGTLQGAGRTVDVQISRLRRRLNDTSEEMIRTIRSVGYIFTSTVTRG